MEGQLIRPRLPEIPSVACHGHLRSRPSDRRSRSEARVVNSLYSLQSDENALSVDYTQHFPCPFAGNLVFLQDINMLTRGYMEYRNYAAYICKGYASSLISVRP